MQQLTCKPDIKSSPPTLRSSPAHACEPTHPDALPPNSLLLLLLQTTRARLLDTSIQQQQQRRHTPQIAALSLWPCSRPPYTSPNRRADVTTRRRHSSTKPYCPSATLQHLPARHTRHPATPLHSTNHSNMPFRPEHSLLRIEVPALHTIDTRSVENLFGMVSPTHRVGIPA